MDSEGFVEISHIFVVKTLAWWTISCPFKFICASVDVAKGKGLTSASFALKQHLLLCCEVSWISSHL